MIVSPQTDSRYSATHGFHKNVVARRFEEDHYILVALVGGAREAACLVAEPFPVRLVFQIKVLDHNCLSAGNWRDRRFFFLIFNYLFGGPQSGLYFPLPTLENAWPRRLRPGLAT